MEGGDIDWGGDDPAAVNEIDYNISLEDSGIKVESSGLAGGVAKNDQALTILDSPSYRDQFLDELFEVTSIIDVVLFLKPNQHFYFLLCSWKRSSKCVYSN